MAVGALCVSGATSAQFSRLQSEIEIKGLDLHPRGSFQRELAVYGALDLGARLGKRSTGFVECGDGRLGELRQPRLSNVGPSALGLHGVEPLDRNAMVAVRLEHGFAANEGVPADACGRFFNREVSVGLGHRDLGILSVGRMQTPAWDVALMADPWFGNSVASLQLEPLRGGSDGNVALDSRVDRAVAYESAWMAQRIRIQALLAKAMDCCGGDTVSSGAIHYRYEGLRVAVGWQRWGREDHWVPISVTLRLREWQGMLFAGGGQREGRGFSEVGLGAVRTDTSGPRLGEWRLGLAWKRRDAQEGTVTLSAGRRWPLGRNTALGADVSVEQPGRAHGGVKAQLGMRHAFTL